MMKRRFPKPRELAPLLKVKAPTLNGKKRRLESALTMWDLRAIATIKVAENTASLRK